MIGPAVLEVNGLPECGVKVEIVVLWVIGGIAPV